MIKFESTLLNVKVFFLNSIFSSVIFSSIRFRNLLDITLTIKIITITTAITIKILTQLDFRFDTIVFVN